jgi:cyclophilin family peptidyl-prolyl cis-trans isomerase
MPSRFVALFLAVGVFRTSAAAQSGPLTAVDSQLVAHVLLAEDRRDSSDAAFALALAHADPRVRLLAARGLARIRDPRFAARDSLMPTATPSVTWPEPAWRLRMRALTPRTPCDSLAPALRDEAHPVRARAMQLMATRCQWDAVFGSALRGNLMRGELWSGGSRAGGSPSWHDAGAAIEAAAVAGHRELFSAIPRLARRDVPSLRRSAARAAATIGDTATLRLLAADPDANVREAAIEGLAKVAGRADDARYLAALDDPAHQVVRAAALALRGSLHPDLAPRALAAWTRWVARQDASAHDVRTALLAAAGRPVTDDRPPLTRSHAPSLLVPLALGADVRLRITMDSASGGGHFDVRLRGDLAPMMAARIAELAESGWYDGTTWHRAEYDFVLQGGSPGANEYHGHRDFLRDELGTLPHPRGSVGMSTRGHDTGDAQWFINLRDNARLTRDYTVFAEVVAGMDVVDARLEGDVIASIRLLR